MQSTAEVISTVRKRRKMLTDFEVSIGKTSREDAVKSLYLLIYVVRISQESLTSTQTEDHNEGYFDIDDNSIFADFKMPDLSVRCSVFKSWEETCVCVCETKKSACMCACVCR